MRWVSAVFSGMVLCALAPAVSHAMGDPDRIPVPVPRPSLLSAFTVPVPLPKPSTVKKARFPVSSILTGLPEEEEQCRGRLHRQGVHFVAAAAVEGKGGCGVAHPVKVTGLAGNVSISGDTTLNCTVAEALAGWVDESAAPAAKRIYGSELVRIDQFSSYVCRTRNSQSGAKLSEHAKGNAIDIGRFVLADGTVIEVGFPASGETRRKQFLDTVRDAGCSHFTTVLGPGSDVFHANHFHFDMAQRRGGFRYCR